MLTPCPNIHRSANLPVRRASENKLVILSGGAAGANDRTPVTTIDTVNGDRPFRPLRKQWAPWTIQYCPQIP
jgi:hypothetical protein